jgi:hypothetical protein
VKKARRRARSGPENTICRKNEEDKGPTLHFRCNLSRVDAAAPKHYRSNRGLASLLQGSVKLGRKFLKLAGIDVADGPQ